MIMGALTLLLAKAIKCSIYLFIYLFLKQRKCIPIYICHMNTAYHQSVGESDGKACLEKMLNI